MFRFRSKEGVFADIGSDYGVLHRSQLLRIGLWRTLILALVVGVTFAEIGVEWRVVLLAIPIFVALNFGTAVGSILAIPSLFLFGSSWWLPVASVTAASLYRQRIEPVRAESGVVGSWRPVTLLPKAETLLLVTLRCRFTVTCALDLAMAGFPLRAADNVEAALKAIGEKAPSCRAMLTLVQAQIAYENDAHSDAVLLIEDARLAAQRAAPAPRAWVLQHLGDLLGELGDRAASLAFTEHAAMIVPARRDGLEFEIYLRLARRRRAESSQVGSIQAAHRARLICVARNDLLGLLTSELVLLEIVDMPIEEQTEVMDWLVSLARSEYRHAPPIPSNIVGAVEAAAGESAFTAGRRDNAADHFVRSTVAYDRAQNPVQRALVVTRLALLLSGPLVETQNDVNTIDKQRDDCILAAKLAIEVFHTVRYALPTSQWRQHWIQTMATAYEIALAATAQSHDAARLASLIELSKAQAIPALHESRVAGRLDTLNAFLEARHSLFLNATGDGQVVDADSVNDKAGQSSSDSQIDALRALVNADPVHLPLPPVVGGISALETADSAGVNVEQIVSSVAGADALYFTTVVAGEQYYWALYDPVKGWLAGSCSLSINTDTGRAVNNLTDALPLRKVGEDETNYLLRLGNSVLWAENTPDARLAELALAKAAGRALLPGALCMAVKTRQAAEGCRLLISMPGVLSAVPLGFLCCDADTETRLVELTDIQVLPSLEMARKLGERPPPRESAAWPISVVGVFATRGVPAVFGPSEIRSIVDIRIPVNDRKGTLQRMLQAAASERAATAYLSGHIESFTEPTADPLRSGLRLADPEFGISFPDTHLTVADLVDGSRFPMPDRVLLLGCSSIGVVVGGRAIGVAPTHSPASDHLRWPLAGEWVGFGAACLLAGARSMICTMFDQPDDLHAQVLDHRIARMFELSEDPVRGLAAVQRDALRDWRDGRTTPAISAMCYAVVSC